tara:strand:- start:560 stop:760 length:201 start_codon:yes stop_codon:yes gene_type:complete
MVMVLLNFDVNEILSSFKLSQILEILAIFLLFFITISVVYLSFVDWKDKRRRKKNNSIKGNLKTSK